MLVASLTLPILPAPNVFCSCQSPTILALGLSRPFRLPFCVPAPLLLEARLDTAAKAASSRTSRMVGSCGVAEGNELAACVIGGLCDDELAGENAIESG
jgi:hypothetical protein